MEISTEDREEFINEALELLSIAESALMAIEDGANFTSKYDSIFRSFHSIKGASGMLGMTYLNAHMHKIEDDFGKLKSRTELTQSQCTYFLKAIDTARIGLDGNEISFDYDTKISEQEVEKIESVDAFIVDDEEDLVEILGAYLAREKISWRGFSSPSAALEAIKLSPPRIVLTDLSMPQMDGLTLSREIKKIYSELPIIIVSGYLSREALLEASKAGISGFVEKPAKHNTVITQVKQALVEAEMASLLDTTIKIILFQLPEIEEYLLKKGKSDNFNLLKTDIIKLLERKRLLKKLRTS